MLSSNMLLPNLIQLIDVTFSTPTGDCTHCPGMLPGCFETDPTANTSALPTVLAIVQLLTFDFCFAGDTLDHFLDRALDLRRNLGSNFKFLPLDAIHSQAQRQAIEDACQLDGLSDSKPVS